MLPSLSIPTPPSLALEYDDPAADAGSGVPLGWLSIPYWLAKLSAEYWLPALVGPLALPSRGPKLPDLECAALLSDPPLAEAPWIALGRPFFNDTSYDCVCKLPFGVASCNLGRPGRPVGRAVGGCGVEVCRESAGVLREREERSGMEFTGRALGDGGMARPSLGGRPVVLREPGIGGRRSGAGLDM